MKIFKLINPRIALDTFYYPGLWGGLSINLFLLILAGGFEFFYSPSLTNLYHLFYVILLVIFSARSIQDLYRIRNGIKFPRGRKPARNAFIPINMWPIVYCMTIDLSLVYEWKINLWTILGIIFSIFFALWGVFVEVSCYKNHLIPDGFIKSNKKNNVI